MSRSNIAVSDEIADRLSKISERENKTSYAVANECLDAALAICERGGHPDEIFGAWMMNHIGKDIGAFQWIGRNLIERLVRDFSRIDPQKFRQLWEQAGFNFAVYLQVCFPTIDDVVSLIRQLERSFNVGRVEFLEVRPKSSEEKRSYHLIVFTPYSEELMKYIVEFYRGLLSAYGLELVDSKIVPGTVRVEFVSNGKLSKVEPSVMNEISGFKGME